jgi:hypothetical protein
MIFSAAIREELLVGTNFIPGSFTADNTITGPVPPWLEKGSHSRPGKQKN